MANVEDIRVLDTTEERGVETVPWGASKKRDQTKAKEVVALEHLVGNFGENLERVEEKLERVEFNFKTLEERVIEEVDKVKDEHLVLEDRFEQFEDKVMAMLESLKESIEAMRGDIALCKKAAASGEASTSSPRVEVPRPECFKGVRDAKEVENFLWQMEQYFENLGLNDEARKIKAATPYLTDTAMLWWRRKHADIERGACRIDTWEDFKRELKRHFYPENVVYEARRRLRDLRQRGSMQDYVQEFTTLMLQIPNMSEDELLFYFIDGLQHWAKQEVQRRNVQSVDEAIAVAESLIDFRPLSNVDPSRRRDKSPTIGGGEHHDGQGRDNQRRPPTRNGDRGFARREYEERKNAFMPKLACYICKGPHLMKDCPKLGSLSAMVEEHETKTHEEEEMSRMGSLQLLTALEAKTTPTTSRKGLMYVEAMVNGKPTQALVDTGATHNFVTEDEARRLGLRWTKGDGWLKAANARAQPLNGVARGVRLRLGTWEGQVNFSVAPMDDYKIVLGMDFLQQATAIPMPSFNTVCILEKGATCMIPTTEGPIKWMKGGSHLSAMRVVKWVKKADSLRVPKRAPLVVAKASNQDKELVLMSKDFSEDEATWERKDYIWHVQDDWRHTRRRGRRQNRWGRM